MITAIREHPPPSNIYTMVNGSVSTVSYYLWKQKSGINHLDKCLKHIIGITWESAAVPSITMIIAVGLYYSNSVCRASSSSVHKLQTENTRAYNMGYGGRSKNKHRHLVLSFILLTGKFYIIGIFRTLNSRSRIRRKMKNTDMGRTSVANDDSDAPATVSDEELTRVEAGMGLDLSDVSTFVLDYCARVSRRAVLSFSSC